MKRLLSCLSIMFVFSIIVSLSMLQMGCEDAKGLDGLVITPENANISTNGIHI